MKTLLLSLVLASSLLAADAWELALPGWSYEFPRDHHSHPGFKTEWWYFTGQVSDAQGHRFGYQLTFFRQGIRPPKARGAETSRFIVDDLKFAHCAMTDVTRAKFRFQQKLSRGAFGEAGFEAGARLAWIDDWTLTLGQDGAFQIHTPDLDLTLRTAKPWAIHGLDGVSQKADGLGRASHYYSGTRLDSRGTLAVGGRRIEVSGGSWFDHEWASNQLTPEQAGWDWFSVQLDDGAELMLYRMRTRDGGTDPHSSGTFIGRDGTTRHLTRDDFTLTPLRHWKSRETGAQYPLAWQLTAPGLGLELKIETPVKEQELVLQPIAYWEGVIDVQGARDGQAARGHGYMELTGYAGPLVGLSSER